MDDAVKQSLERAMRDRFGDRVRFGEPLSRRTSLRIGGPAEVWLEVETAAEIGHVLEMAMSAGVQVLVLGAGTNVLVSDRGVRGIVLRLGREFRSIRWRPNGSGAQARAGAAVPFRLLAAQAARRSLAGLEFAEGIPGSLGGGLLMNAGAFGGEIADVIEAIEGVDATGVQHLSRDRLRFGYRRFDLPPSFIVTHLEFRLAGGEAAAIRARMLEYRRRRQSRQPLRLPNAGSVFKNPPGQYAGSLIEEVGLKGKKIGGAMVSQQHANFIVNVGSATAADVRALIEEIQRKVWQAKQISLELEVKPVGEWDTR